GECYIGLLRFARNDGRLRRVTLTKQAKGERSALFRREPLVRAALADGAQEFADRLAQMLRHERELIVGLEPRLVHVETARDLDLHGVAARARTPVMLGDEPARIRPVPMNIIAQAAQRLLYRVGETSLAARPEAVA